MWGIIRLPIINFYESAFNDDNIKQFEVEEGIAIKNVPQLENVDFNNTVIFLNGKISTSNSILKENDICSVRQFPSGDVVLWTTVAFLAVDGFHALITGEDMWIEQGARKLAKWLLSPNENSEDTQAEQIPSIQGGKNQSGKNQPIPIILGETYYTPLYIGTPYSALDPSLNNDGEDEFFTGLYCLGQKDIEVKDFQLGIYGLATNSEKIKNGNLTIDGDGVGHITYPYSTYKTELEIRDTGEVDLYNQKVVQENFGTELLNTEGAEPLKVLPFSARYTKKVQLEIQFASLLRYNDDGDKKNCSVELCFAYSLDGGHTYSPLVQEGNWGNSSNVSIERTGDTSISYNNTTVTASTYKFTGCIVKQLRYCLIKEFSFAEAKTNITSGNSVVEFVIWRKNVKEVDTNYQDTCFFNKILSYCYDYKQSFPNGKNTVNGTLINQSPLVERFRDKTTRLGFKIKNGQEIQGTLKELNCICMAKGKTYTSENGWSENTVVTNNPASMCLMVMESDLRGKYKYPASMIDYDSFGELFRRCDEFDSSLFVEGSPLYNGKRYVVNGVLNSQKKTSDVLSAILSVSNSYLVLRGTKYGVFIDEPQDNPVMVLNNQNVLEASNSKAFDEPVHAYQCKFINGINYYQQDTMVCIPSKYESIAEENRNILDIEMLFYTDPKRVYRKAMRMIAEKELRPETWTRKVGLEGNLIEIGSLVELQDDTISVGIGDGAEIIGLTTATGGNIVEIKTDGNFTVTQSSNTQYAIKITQADGIHKPVVRTCLVDINGDGEYSNFILTNPILASDTVRPSINDIVTFGIYQKETVKALCFGKKDNGDGTFNLSLVPYSEDVYNCESGDIPEFISNVTQPLQTGVAIDEDKNKATINDLYTTILNPLIQGNVGEIESPSTPFMNSVIAEENCLRCKCQVGINGLKNSVSRIDWEITKTGNEEDYELVGSNSETEFLYYYDRNIDGYLEREDFALWKVRCKVINIYERESLYSNQLTVNTDSYGTWTVFSANVGLRVSDRTITLLLSQPETNGLKVYGNIRYKIQIKKPEFFNLETNQYEPFDLQFYKPSLNKEVYPIKIDDVTYGNEDNYKDGEGYLIVDNIFVQTMPLEGQGNNNLRDTQYRYRIVAFNEATEDNIGVEVNATALCTSLRDIVKANETVKQAYISQLSAISANLGVIKQGGLSGDEYNYWALSDVQDDLGNQRRQGAMRVGGRDEYLRVDPVIDAYGNISSYTITFKVGNFSVTSTQTKLEGEQIIYGSDGVKTDRVLLSPTKVSLQHNATPEDDNTWKDVTFMDVNGTNGKSVLSKDILTITNADITERRMAGNDIGCPLPSPVAEVYHFDTDLFNQNGQSTITIDYLENEPRIVSNGSMIKNNLYFQPAILSYAPYSEVCGALYGQYSITKESLTSNYIVDFWIMYLSAENQVLFNIGNNDLRISVEVFGKEPFYNIVNVEDENDLLYNEESKRIDADNFFAIQSSEECYFADNYNDQLPTESVYNTVVKESFNSSYSYYIYNSELNFYERTLSVNPLNYDVLVMNGLYKPSYAYNSPKFEGSNLKVQNGTSTQYISLFDVFEKLLEEGLWYHIGISKQSDNLSIYLDNKKLDIPIESTENAQNITYLFNPTKQSFIVDELLFDTQSDLNLEDFAKRTLSRKPYGALDDKEDWFVLQAKDLTKFRTNIFQSKVFADAVIPIGFCYTQLPNKAYPWELWTFTVQEQWQNISEEYADSFFRVEGTNSQEFENQENAQSAELPNIRGKSSVHYYNGDMGANNLGAMYCSTNPLVGSGTYGGGVGNNQSVGINFTASRGQTTSAGNTVLNEADSVYKDGGEVRPNNYTVRIWKRIQ